jgi:NAD+ synthase (glutamine-hydrolysing)
VRIALAQLNQTVGDLDGNLVRLDSAYKRAAEAGVAAVVFPELAITGYPPEDLVLKPGFVRDNLSALKKFAAGTGETAAVIGFVEQSSDGLFNAAAVCSNGKVQFSYRKCRLPNYGPFDENRYFEVGSDESATVNIAGVKCGVTICEDIWDAHGPVSQQAKAGAVINLNLNASPYHRGKWREREAMLVERARSANCAIIYVNQVGGQDELVFDGASTVIDATGKVITRAAQHDEDFLVVDFDPDSGDIVVIDDSHAREPLDPIAEVYNALVLGTRDYVRKNGFTDVVIGLSGGIDSSLVAAIAVDALGREHVHGVSMPSRYSSDGSKTDAYALAEALGIDCQTVSIEPAFDAFVSMLKSSFAGRDADLTEENLQSRCRGMILMAMSNKFNWMVLTTGNKSEMAVGYFTIYGDSAGGYAVIKDVLKVQVYALSRYVNERAGREVVPESVLTKAPSAELRPDQRDDQSLPPYEVLDPILEMYVEQDMTASQIVGRGFDEALVRRIARLVDLSEYKRRQCAPGVRITTKAFGKDRRLPITNAYRG